MRVMLIEISKLYVFVFVTSKSEYVSFTFIGTPDSRLSVGIATLTLKLSRDFQLDDFTRTLVVQYAALLTKVLSWAS